MKNEPVVSYNHMQEDSSIQSEDTAQPSFNLYILLAADVVIITAIVFAAVKIIF